MYIIEVIDSGIYYWKEENGLRSWTNSMRDAAKFDSIESAEKKLNELLRYKPNIQIMDISHWVIY